MTRISRRLVFVGLVFAALAGGASETLVDFSTPGARYPVGSGFYRADCAVEQMTISGDGLTVRTDADKEARPFPWLTFSVGPSQGAKIDWTNRRFVLVLAAPPTGRMRTDIALNFTDRAGETFQFMRRRESYNDDGEFCLSFDVGAPHGKGWGGSVNDGVMDAPIRLTAINVHFNAELAGAENRKGEVTFVRIEADAEQEKQIVYPRTVRSREAISVDTMYPGAAPFPGAKALVFRLEPAYTGTAKLVLSFGSSGSAWEGRRATQTAAVTNGLARFAVDLPYGTQYEFYALEHQPATPVAQPIRIVSAAGEFVQSAAEAMRLSAETGNDLHLVRDATERPYLTVRNPSDGDRTWKTAFVLTDIFERRLEVPFDRTVKAGETVRVDLPWPLPAKGLWRVRAEVTGDDGSRAVKETRFAFIDRHDVTPIVGKPKFRMGIHYHGTHYWPDKVDRTIRALVAAGAKFTRCDYDHMWADIERAPGVYSWEKSDAMIEKLRAAGLALDIIFAGNPQWAMTPESIAKNAADRAKGLRVRNSCGVPRPGLFLAFCEKFAARYGSKIDYYETGNEWDLCSREAVAQADLLRQQQEAYEGLHAGCPGVCVIPNGWTTSVTPPGGDPKVWHLGLIEAFADHPEFYDAWALHNHGDFPNFVYKIDEQFLPMRAAHGLRTRPWLLNETALTSYSGCEDVVARTVWMKILFGWSRGARDYIWYNLRATGWFDGGEPGYGLITADFRPRAGYAAFAALSTIFQGLDFDAALHSRKLRHLLRFRGRSQAVNGLVVAGWDMQDAFGVRGVELRTDAKSAVLSDLMGNRTPVTLKDGRVSFPLAFAPQALLLEGATWAEVADLPALTRERLSGFFVRRKGTGNAPTFRLAGAGAVHNLFEANPAMTHRLWKGNGDLSARVWLTSTDTGLHVRARVTDDVAAAGDGFELLISEGKGAPRSVLLKPARRAGAITFYEADVPVAAGTFGLDLRVQDDDGEGRDAYLFLRNASEDPLRVTRER